MARSGCHAAHGGTKVAPSGTIVALSAGRHPRDSQERPFVAGGQGGTACGQARSDSRLPRWSIVFRQRRRVTGDDDDDEQHLLHIHLVEWD